MAFRVASNTAHRLAALAILLLAGTLPVFGQNQQVAPPSSPRTEDKAQQIVKRGIESVGGSNYLGVRTVIGRGFFTEFKDGAPTVPARFVDYIAYPDKERTEFTSSGIRSIQTNNGGKGWFFDGATKNLKDQSTAQLEEFTTTMRTTVENLLHGWWQKEGASLSYAGRREAGLGLRNEAVRVTYPDGFWVEFEFSAKEGRPAKVIYKRKKRNLDSDEMEEVTEE